MKIVILDGFTSNPGDLSWDKMEALGNLTVYEYTPNQTADIVDRLQDCEIALTNKTVITAEVMEACPGLQYIGVLATGYNVVDMAAAAMHVVLRLQMCRDTVHRQLHSRHLPCFWISALTQRITAKRFIMADGAGDVISVSGIIH